MIPHIKLSTREMSFVAVMTALCISTNYLMIGLVNIKLMDLFVFVSGYLMGPFIGALVGVLTWLVYGTLNPYGFSLPIFFATSLGETVYGVVGGLCARFRLEAPKSISVDDLGFWALNFKIGILGFLSTFIYDLFTNIVSGIVVGIPILVSIIMGIPFSITHEVSNFAFFFFGGTVLISTIQNLALKGR